MSLTYGPKTFDIKPSNASQVTVLRLPEKLPASLSQPIVVAAGSVTFTVSQPGSYLVVIKEGQSSVSDTVFLSNQPTYDITDPRSYSNHMSNTDVIGDSDVSTYVADVGSITNANLVAQFIQPAGKTKVGPTQPAPIFNVKDYGAVGNNASDDSDEIQATIDAAAASRGAVYFPYGTYRVSKQLNVPQAMRIYAESVKTTIWFYQGSVSADYGFNVEGPGLGGANQDTMIIERMSLKGNAKALIRIYGVGLFRVNNIVTQNSQSPLLHIDTCQDAVVNDIDMFSNGVLDAIGTTGGGAPSGSSIYIVNSNMLTLNMIRTESPRTAAIYIKDSGNIKILEGKVDGGGSSTPSHDAFLVSDSSTVLVQNFNLHGFEDIPTEVRGYGSFNFDNVTFSNGTANACTRAQYVSQSIWPTDTQPGHKQAPRVFFRNCQVNAQSYNDSDKLTKSLIYSVAPDPLWRYYNEVIPMRVVSGAWASGNAYREVVLHYDPGTGVFQTAPNNDRWTGAWLVHKQTGKRVRIYQNFSTGQSRLDMGPQTPWTSLVATDFPTGDFYQLEFNAENGVQVESINTKVGYRRRMNTATFTLAYHAATVTVNSSIYSNFKTTLTLSAAADSSWIGMYLTSPSTNKAYLIREVIGSTLVFDYDQTAVLTAGTWFVRAGKVKGDAIFDGGTIQGIL